MRKRTYFRAHKGAQAARIGGLLRLQRSTIDAKCGKGALPAQAFSPQGTPLRRLSYFVAGSGASRKGAIAAANAGE